MLKSAVMNMISTLPVEIIRDTLRAVICSYVMYYNSRKWAAHVAKDKVFVWSAKDK